MIENRKTATQSDEDMADSGKTLPKSVEGKHKTKMSALKPSFKSNGSGKSGQKQRRKKVLTASLSSSKPASDKGPEDSEVNLPGSLPSTPLEESQDTNANNHDSNSETKKVQKNKGKMKNVRSRAKRREMLDDQRDTMDTTIRNQPQRALWEWYKMYAGESLALFERLSKQWTPNQIYVITSQSDQSLVPQIKNIVGDDYVTVTRKAHSESLKLRRITNAVTSVACIGIGYGSESVNQFATRVQDGTLVGEVLSRQSSIESQRQWLLKCRHHVAITLCGTAKRIHDLINNGSLTLEHTQAVIIDLTRSLSLCNMFENPNASNDLFALMREHIIHLVDNGRLKIILAIQAEDEKHGQVMPMTPERKINQSAEDQLEDATESM